MSHIQITLINDQPLENQIADCGTWTWSCDEFILKLNTSHGLVDQRFYPFKF